MSTPLPTEPAVVNPQKSRRGLNRLWHAAGYSLNGLRAGWGEPAFRMEALLAVVLVPLAFWLGRDWAEVALLAGSVVLLMIVELLNTAVEAALDRIGCGRRDEADEAGAGARQHQRPRPADVDLRSPPRLVAKKERP